ncbi:hypothetical protein [Leptospira levettii]|uniref:hypothetical protein n=1 Tax=Leptospira levettii TaxID=2023178 RepID=UPI000C29F989|nr:hypothetical protein [Leptospira levettii]PJZ87602.1 hypothetical protein CH368_15950 [Leptospira levettii]
MEIKLSKIEKEKLKKSLNSKWGIHFDKETVLVGIRGYHSMNGVLIKNNDEIDVFNDTILVFDKSGEVYTYDATLDPGLHWILKPMAAILKKGTARLKEGVYRYKIGLHKGFPALVQASAVSVHRDTNRNAIWEENEIVEKGWFAINIHMKLRDSKNVSSNSAGCSVINSLRNQRPWISFWDKIISAKNNHGQEQFVYAVLDQSTAEGILN